MSESKLLPCPFCGSEARLDEWIGGGHGYSYTRYGVFCDTDGCPATDERDKHGKPAEAIAAWNRRAPSSLSQRKSK